MMGGWDGWSWLLECDGGSSPDGEGGVMPGGVGWDGQDWTGPVGLGGQDWTGPVGLGGPFYSIELKSIYFNILFFLAL